MTVKDISDDGTNKGVRDKVGEHMIRFPQITGT